MDKFSEWPIGSIMDGVRVFCGNPGDRVVVAFCAHSALPHIGVGVHLDPAQVRAMAEAMLRAADYAEGKAVTQ